MGEPLYRPGLAAVLPLDPAGPLRVEEAMPGAAPESARRFALELEPGIAIRGFVSGAPDGRPVVVVHGGPGFPPTAPWAGLEAFGATQRFWYPHQRGSGWSDRPLDRFASPDYGANLAALDAKLGLAVQVADLERLRRALGVERLDLVGHSFGGLIACLYAIEFPAHVGRILLVAPAPMVVFPPASGGLYPAIREGLPEARRAAYDAWLKDFFDYGKLFQRGEAELTALNAGVIPFFRETVAGATGEAGTTADGNDPALTGGWMMPAVFFGLGQRHDWSAAFAGIGAPVTLVAGDADLAFDARDAGQYAVIPGLQTATVPGAGHFLPQSAEFAALPAVRAWMAAGR
jgi:proline iminopeptidase